MVLQNTFLKKSAILINKCRSILTYMYIHLTKVNTLNSCDFFFLEIISVNLYVKKEFSTSDNISQLYLRDVNYDDI